MSGISNLIIQILTLPAILMSILNIVGLALQKISWKKNFLKTTKILYGYVMILFGGSIIYKILSQLDVLFVEIFNLQGNVFDHSYITDMAIDEYLTAVVLIIILGYCFSGLLIVFTRFKNVSILSNSVIPLATLIALLLVICKMEIYLVVVIGAMILAMMMTICPSLLKKVSKDVLKHEKYSISCNNNSLISLSSLLCMHVFKDRRDIEHLVSLKDYRILYTIVAFVIGCVYCVLALIFNFKALDFISYDYHWMILIFFQAASLGIGTTLLIEGIQFMLYEILEGFKGFKMYFKDINLVLDSNFLLVLSPISALVGFVMVFVGSTGGTLCIFFLNMLNLPVAFIMPTLTSSFLIGSVIGVVANRLGGFKACLLSSFISGLLMVLLASFTTPILAGLSFSSTTYYNADMNLLIMALAVGALYLNKWGVAGIVTIVFLLPFGHGWFNKYLKDKKAAEIEEENSNEFDEENG